RRGGAGGNARLARLAGAPWRAWRMGRHSRTARALGAGGYRDRRRLGDHCRTRLPGGRRFDSGDDLDGLERLVDSPYCLNLAAGQLLVRPRIRVSSMSIATVL